MIARRPEPAAAADPAALARALRFRLEVNRLFGWQVPIGRPAPAPAGAGDPSPAAGSSPVPGAPPSAAAGAPACLPAGIPPGDLEAERTRRRALLGAIDREVQACRECPLCEGRSRTVFGVGDPCARLMFVGEGPGFDEDRLGEPFVGKAGKLLDRMIAAMGLEREQVYIANIVKCRPPNNRVPQPREVVSCFPYLRRQIETIRPAVICALGATPTRTFLRTTEPMGRLRGRFFEWEGIPLLPTFHPAYLLRQPQEKRLAWEDLQKLIRFLGLPAPRP